MRIRVKVGDVEITYSEPTKETDYPKITSSDKTTGVSGRNTRHELVLKSIEAVADKAAQIHKEMYLWEGEMKC